MYFSSYWINISFSKSYVRKFANCGTRMGNICYRTACVLNLDTGLYWLFFYDALIYITSQFKIKLFGISYSITLVSLLFSWELHFFFIIHYIGILKSVDFGYSKFMYIFSTIYKKFNKKLKNISAQYILLKLEPVYRRKPTEWDNKQFTKWK